MAPQVKEYWVWVAVRVTEVWVAGWSPAAAGVFRRDAASYEAKLRTLASHPPAKEVSHAASRRR